jgi:outer membrane receptor protein involved in Fe transport
MKFTSFVVGLLLAATLSLHAQAPAPTGRVTGTVMDPSGTKPLEFISISVRQNGAVVRTGATDAKGRFDIEGVPHGAYQIAYGTVGTDQTPGPSLALDATHSTVDVGRIRFGASETVNMQKFEVSAQKEAFYNSIDRKVYNVGKDLQSTTGSASDLLQNVPSIQVDIEGNVALRGDSNVLILINGKTSTMMGKNRAAVLEQMPADGIDKIEVITNPSAKYKPDGTAGIINITLKKKQEPGYSGSVRASVGNDSRSNANVTANFNPGKFNLFGSAGVRQDDRPRTVADDRAHFDAASNSFVSTSQRTTESMRPLSKIAQAGLDYKLSDQTKVGGNLRYNHRDFERHSTVSNVSHNAAGVVTEDYDRLRVDPEWQRDLEFTGTFQHSLAEDREFNVEVRHGKTAEQEDNRYTNVYRTPARLTAYDFTLIKTTETNTETSADYVHPLGDSSKLEGGYNGQISETDMDFHGSFLNAAGTLLGDPTKTNHFIYDAAIHAVYGTYARKFGRFGLLGGLRFEHARIDTNQVTANLQASNDYNRFYPSLHLSYDLTDTQQLQLNYSHRVHRPEGDDLNPYPEYQDPFNVRAGNPKLVPEDIHSLEAGWQRKKDDTTYLATVYYRYRYHGMTEVSRYISSTTLLTTKENLGTSRATGLELGANTRLFDKVSVNASGNAYRSEIDASNLGFSSSRTSFAWDAKLNLNYDLSKNTLLQFNGNYTAKRLTPQGYRYPTKVANIGLRHNLADKKTSLILTVSDAFNSLRERTHIDTPVLRQDISRRRSSQIVYVGVIYTFGKSGKKQKNDLQFDNSTP